MAQNKVAFGLSNAHYAVITEEDGVVTYGTPVRFPGMVSLTLEPKGEQSDFFADNLVYYTTNANMGYDGTLEVALLTEEFRKDVLGETVGADGVFVEGANANPKKIALMFEFDGDQKATRHVLPYVSVSRPGHSAATKTESVEPGTGELTFVASPRPGDYVIKLSTGSTTTDEIYNAWYTEVYTGA